MRYYLKATGLNRFAGGTHNWLKIRSIRKNNNSDYYIATVICRNSAKEVEFDVDNTPNLIFAKGKWPNIRPISAKQLIREYNAFYYHIF